MPYSVLKRILDLSLSFMACVALLPLCVLLAAAVSLDSPGPPLFLQQRIGRGGKPFHIFKFRTMVKDAASQGLWYTSQNDSRITRMGRFLRGTSLDELPQLINVLIGDMSLVGPRPNIPGQQSLYTDTDWQLRHRVRPGITGLAQVNGRSHLTDAQQLHYDLAYAANPTLKGDIDIVIKTFAAVLKRHGAN